MGDTIYRDDAIDVCERWKKKTIKELNREGSYMADILLRFMQRMPSADKPQGEWIIHDEDDVLVHAHCSLCGWEAHYYETDVVEEANYCPKCGRRMGKRSKR